MYMKNNLKWFSVKTLYIIKAIGKPRHIDKLYVNKAIQVEERIVLFKAKNESSALAKAEIEAKKYCRYAYVNIYGQKVVTKFLHVSESFELFDNPENGIEIFSSNEIRIEDISKNKLIDMKFGKKEKDIEIKARRKFLNSDFNKFEKLKNN